MGLLVEDLLMLARIDAQRPLVWRAGGPAHRRLGRGPRRSDPRPGREVGLEVSAASAQPRSSVTTCGSARCSATWSANALTHTPTGRRRAVLTAGRGPAPYSRSPTTGPA